MRQATDRARTPPVSCRNRRTISSFDQGVAEGEFLPLVATPQAQDFGRLVEVHHLGNDRHNDCCTGAWCFRSHRRRSAGRPVAELEA